MDSNGRWIGNELRRYQYSNDNEYIMIPDYRTVEDLQRIPRHHQVIEELRTLDQIIVMMGTNNIKRGDDPNELAREYIQAIIEITRKTNTAIKTVDIPPIDPQRYPNCARNVEIYNRAIHRPNKHIKLRRIKGENPRDMLEKDGIHLVEEGAKRIAKDLHDMTLKPKNLETQKKYILQIPPEVTSRIIGRKGAVIRKLEDQFQVRIVIDQNTAIIRGTKRAAAADAIKEEIEEAQSRAIYD
jgi:hypothetical protein